MVGSEDGRVGCRLVSRVVFATSICIPPQHQLATNGEVFGKMTLVSWLLMVPYGTSMLNHAKKVTEVYQSRDD